MDNTLEVSEEQMSEEAFAKAKEEGMVFSSEEEAKQAAAEYERQLAQFNDEKEFLIRFNKWNEEQELLAMSEEDRKAYLEKEERRNLPENVYWRRILSQMLQDAEMKRKMKKKSDAAREARQAKIESQLTLKAE